MIKTIFNHTPQVAASAKIAENASVVGNVQIGEEASVFYGAVLRGDINAIKIGDFSNIQDNCTVHVDHEFPCIIGKYVTVGHNAVIHGCTVEDCCIVGMGAVILDGAVIGRGSVIGAGAVVKENQVIPPFSLVAGIPAVIKKQLGEETLEHMKGHALRYVDIAAENFG